jgi:hypothetical protein
MVGIEIDNILLALEISKNEGIDINEAVYVANNGPLRNSLAVLVLDWDCWAEFCQSLVETGHFVCPVFDK